MDKNLDSTKPNYVLKADEGVLVSKNENSTLGIIKITVWIIVGVIILGSLVFHDNLFSELSWTTRILLIALAIGVIFKGGSKRVSSPIEIQFYDDHLVVYREKIQYKRNLILKKYDKFFYKDIRKCQYRTITKQINIYGIEEGIRYKYNKDGSLPTKPIYHKTTEGLCYFYTTEAPEIDFVSEIERHAPVKVEIVS